MSVLGFLADYSTVDEELVSWLESNGLDRRDINLFVSEGYRLSDVLDLMERDDLRRLGLRGGSELRLWRAILGHRSSPPKNTN